MLLLLLATVVPAHPLPGIEAPEIASRHRMSLPADKGEAWSVVPLDDGFLLLGEGEEGPAVASFDRDFGLRWSRPLSEAGPKAPRHHAVTETDAWLVYAKGKDTTLVRVPRDGAVADRPSFALRRGGRALLDFALTDEAGWFVSGRRLGRGTIERIDLGSGATDPVVPDLPRKSYFGRLIATSPGVDLVAWSVKRRERVQHVLEARGASFEPRLTVRARDFDPPINPLTAERRRLADGRSVVVGSYADEAKGSRAQGLYLARIDDHGLVASSEHHSFTEFVHFFDHLKDRRQRRIAERIEKKRAEGDDLDLDVSFDVHDLVEDPETGHLVLTGEAYHPVYVTRTVTSTQTVNGQVQTVTRTVTEFDGYRFTQAVAAAFTPTGELAWDASLPIGNIQSFAIEPHVRIRVDGDRIAMVYATRKRLFTRVFDKGEVVDDRKQQRRVDDDGENVRRVGETDLAPWADDAFLAWGIQKTDDEGRVFVVERLGPDASEVSSN